MKPLDALTSVPKSLDIARVVAAAGKQAEAQAQSQIAGFAREMNQRNFTVTQATKTVTENRTDADSPGGSGAGYDPTPGKRDGNPDKEGSAGQHPVKGKILDIRGD